MTFTFRNAEESDREAIYQLYRLVMRGFISEIWGWDEQWQRSDFSAHFDLQGITLVLKGHELVGYSHIENQDGKIFIRMIVVNPRHQQNGIGTKLLASVIAAADKKSKNIGLEVFKINEVAKAFYEKHGFYVEGETPSSLIMVHA
ncbi:GNAT family N-acetyltransferase [Methylococcus mesophilus]|uniref:GNAT family N-acetyltransferase n=1 Tax=Methylococcus mesophilus TaxID=2993564 RepID=UPI00224AA89F|nr:GNAT family N-acetyltransferase [Methylococcus mesophilus]UZR27996.1 GNAT family N-acetyltransferase [Methylococcus mesophilus]